MTMRLTGLNSGLDTEAIISELTKAYKSKGEKSQKAQTKLEWKQDAWKSLNTKVYSLYTNISNLRFSSAYATKKATISDASKAKVSAATTAVNGTQKLNVLSTAQSAYMTGNKLKTKDDTSLTADTTLSQLGYSGTADKFQIKTTDEDGKEVVTDISVTQNTKISEVVDALNKAGVNANFDTANGRFYVNSKKTGEKGDFEITPMSGSTDSENALKALGLNPATKNVDGTYNADGAVKVDGTDAKIRLNGVIYTSSTNDFSINGLDITATGVTGDGDDNAITISTDTDTQAIYDTIKDFLTEYNNIINEMTKLYNADSSKGYEPLTDEEKDAMNDTEIEKWENKIKSAVLRRDSTLEGIMEAMKSAMASTYEVNGEKYSLSSFGIQTLGYLNAVKNEQNAYHIDGDEDDSVVSGKEDKLMKAIKEDPDSIIDFMKKLTSGLYTAIDKKMKSTSLSSAYTIYNDKELNSQYSEYSKIIKKWEDKASDQEDYYYKKFSAMEAAMAKLNSSTSSITGLFN